MVPRGVILLISVVLSEICLQTIEQIDLKFATYISEVLKINFHNFNNGWIDSTFCTHTGDILTIVCIVMVLLYLFIH